jgi:hypothetical protein
MWPFSTKKAEVRELYASIRVVSRDVPEKVARKCLKKCMPYLTKKEMHQLMHTLRYSGHCIMRFSEKEADSLDASDSFEIVRRGDVQERESDDCCDDVCDHGCALSYRNSRFYSETNPGIFDELGNLTSLQRPEE